MPQHSKKKLNRKRATGKPSRSGSFSDLGEPGGSPSFKDSVTGDIGATPRMAGQAVEGTIGAPVSGEGQQDYNPTSDALLSGAPLAGAGGRKVNDLIGELREISGQVNRMMSQVDRAIHRLGVHAGEPLKR